MSATNVAHTSSTGPRTPEGKARSSQNAMKHGFTSKNTIIPEGMQKEFDELLEGYEKDIRPVGAIEETLFKQLVQHAWTLRRIELKKTEMATDGKDPLSESADSSKARNYDRVERYQARYEGAFRSTLKELRALQTSRVIQMAIPDPLGFGSFPVTVKASEIVQLAKRTDEWYSNRSIKRLTHYVERDKQNAKAGQEPVAKPISHKDFLTDEEITGLRR